MENINRNNIKITISGICGSGKTNLHFLIKKLLREQGILLNYSPSGDYETEEDFDKSMSKLSFEKILEILKRKNIIVEEVNVNSELHNN